MPWDKPYFPARNKCLDPALYATPGRIVFFTLRVYRWQTAFVHADLNRAVIDDLIGYFVTRRCQLFTYCLMPDHLHFLITPEEKGVCTLAFTDRFKSMTTRRSWDLGWRGKLWQPRNYDHVVRDGEEDLVEIDAYIRANPVRKKFVEESADWPWSGKANPLPL